MGPVIRRIVEVASGPEAPARLLAGVGLSPGVDMADAMREAVAEDAYYDLLERATAADDDGLPFRYAEAVRPDDFAALGLAFKTAPTVREALQRLVRYILVLSDTLEYELRDVDGGATFVLERPHHGRGAALANECALGAATSLMRQVAVSPLSPSAVSFRHARPASTAPHRAFFACPVTFDAPVNALHLTQRTLGTRTRLGDEGLSAFLLARLDQLHAERADRSLAAQVHSAVIDALPDGGVPRRSQIARRLGISERTLHRRLAEDGEAFQTLADRARREAAESLLANRTHSLGEVAFLTGFSDQSAFQRAFKRWTGQTPRSFREAASA